MPVDLSVWNRPGATAATADGQPSLQVLIYQVQLEIWSLL